MPPLFVIGEKMTVNNEIIECKKRFSEELTSLSSAFDAYISVFPSEIKNGLPCFEVCSKECKKAFLNFSSQITSSIKNSDQQAAKISSLLILADSANDHENVLLCADLLQAYESYKINVCRFLDEGYKILNKKDDVPAMTLFRINRILSDAMTVFKSHL